MAVIVQDAPTFVGGVREALRTGRRPGRRLLTVVGVAVVAAGLVLRFYCPSALWLDEAISVHISMLPLSQIHAALREDGAPPLYYVGLHFWMLLFGRGDFAVRAWSGLPAVVALPFFWYAGRRLGGTRVAWITFFLAVTSPFAIYYATDTRMYSLMILWCVLGFLALVRALERPTRGRLVALGLLTAAILYTHYWGVYVITATGLWLLYQYWRHRQGLPVPFSRSGVVRSFWAMLLGSLLFVPWVPTFVFQTLHTGTPWAGAASPADLIRIFNDYAGTGAWAVLLAFAYFGLIVLGVFGRRQEVQEVVPAGAGATTPHRSALADGEASGAGSGAGAGIGSRPGSAAAVEARLADLEEPAVGGTLRARARRGGDRLIGFAGYGPGGAGAAARRREPGHGVTLVLQPNRRAMPVFAVLAGALGLAVVAGAITNAAFVPRYTAAVLPLFLMLVALGVEVLSRRRIVTGTLAVLCLAGLLTGFNNNSQPRTEATQVAQVLNTEAQPGDLVVYCPDQLGPAVSRLITVPGLEQLTFPRAIGPLRVDWINYKQVIEQTNVEAFAEDMLADLPAGHTLWLVWRNGYQPFGGDCGDLASWLSLLKGQGTTVIGQNPGYYEYENLVRYPVG